MDKFLITFMFNGLKKQIKNIKQMVFLIQNNLLNYNRKNRNDQMNNMVIILNLQMKSLMKDGKLCNLQEKVESLWTILKFTNSKKIRLRNKD